MSGDDMSNSSKSGKEPDDVFDSNYDPFGIRMICRSSILLILAFGA